MHPPSRVAGQECVTVEPSTGAAYDERTMTIN